MRLDTSQQLRLSQEMKLSPRIIQAMEILQLPMLALQERIDAEMQSNPVLEVQEEADEPVEAADYDDDRGERDLVVSKDDTNADDFGRLDEMTSEYGSDFASETAPLPSAAPSGERDAKLDAMANTAAASQSLQDYLAEQWAFFTAADLAEPNDKPGDADDVLRAGEAIAESIDDDGYLRTSLEGLGVSCDPPIPLPLMTRALHRIQTFDPLGVGARDLRECLLLQLSALADAGQDVAMPMLLVSRFLREIELNRLPAIVKRTGRSLDDIKVGLATLARLNPRPGSMIASPVTPTIQPDLIVDVDDAGHLIVRLADEQIPALGINEYYSQQARSKNTEKEAKQFLQRNIRSAQWLIEAVAQRRNTMRRVTEEVFAVQREFLDLGPEALKPLPMADIAEKVGVHVATVSRAVSDKYVQTPRGIFPLRMFFSGGTKTASGDDMSWGAVKAKLQEIVDSEDKAKPLNDDKLAAALEAEGITISRRTVAKYRGLMDIPPARKRKEY